MVNYQQSNNKLKISRYYANKERILWEIHEIKKLPGVPAAFNGNDRSFI